MKNRSKKRMYARAGVHGPETGRLPGDADQRVNEPESVQQGVLLKNAWRGLMVTALLYLVVAVLTLPKFPYPGDNFVPRIESIQLAKRGIFGIPYAMRESIKGFDQPKGQYFFANDAKERYYSKYGIAYTVAYLPPVWMELASDSAFDLHRQSPSFFFKLGLYQIVLGLIFVYYLYRLAWLFCRSPWICCVFTLAAIYSTFLWHYLRAPALEIFQLPAFVGVCVHGLIFLRRRRNADGSAGCWFHLLAATLWSGWLVLMRSNFVVLGFAVSAFPFFTDPDAPGNWKAPFVSLGRNWRQYAWALIIPWALIFAILLAFNHIKFGSVFDSGYMQWLEADGTPRTKFGMTYLLPNIKRFLISMPNDFNMFRAYPYALLGVISLIPLARRRLMDALFILAVAVPGIYLLLIYNMADGQWCFGPRYFLYYAIILSLPFLWLSDRLLFKLRREFRLLIVIGCLVPAVYLAWQQFLVNGLHYFVTYQLNGVFRSTKHPAVIKYCQRPRTQFCRDLFYYGQGWESYYPLDVIRPLIPPGQEAYWLQFKGIVDEFAKPNFYFFPGKQSAVKINGAESSQIGPRRR